MAVFGFIPFKNQQINLQLELAKISSGALIAEIFDRLILKIKCQNIVNLTKECAEIKAQKFYTYSTHDTTVASLFLGLGFKTFIFDEYSLPDFGSTIVLELWENENIKNAVPTKIDEHYYIKIYYYKSYSVDNPVNIGKMLPKCKEKGCPISYLAKRADLLRPRPDFRTYCHQLVTSNAVKFNNTLIIMLISVVLLFLKN
uniref:acid phosphatase n=1 Tax=Panagrolaimus davidi TaxID=227884 RepID=A0A914P4W8_9BILA